MNYNRNYRNYRPNYNNYSNNYNNYSNYENRQNVIVDYLYENIKLEKYNYKIIKYENDLEPLATGTFHILPTFTGKNCLLIFKKISNKYYSILIDRSTLSSNKKSIDITEVKMELDEEIYNGTIIDGMLLNSSKEFIINDMFWFCGNNVTNDKICNKLINIQNYIKEKKVDNIKNELLLVVNNLYMLKDIIQVINEYIPSLKYCKHVKGLTFMPDRSGTKYLYMYNNGVTDNVDEKILPGLRNLEAIITNDYNNVTKILKIKKSNILDVYQLYSAKIVNEKMKYNSVGIASIPTLVDSQFCKSLFINNEESAYVKCKYDNLRNKWIPFEKVNAKKPDII